MKHTHAQILYPLKHKVGWKVIILTLKCSWKRDNCRLNTHCHISLQIVPGSTSLGFTKSFEIQMRFGSITTVQAKVSYVYLGCNLLPVGIPIHAAVITQYALGLCTHGVHHVVLQVQMIL